MRTALGLSRAQVLLIGLLWLLYLAAIGFVYTHHPDGAGDYIAYDRAGRALNAGHLLYSGIDGDKPYLYPPLLAILLMPITAKLDFRGATLVWLVANVVLVVIALSLIMHTLPSRRLRLLFWVASLFYAPLLMSFWHGQATILMFALVVGAWAAHRQGHRGWAGILLAAGVWVKIFPVVLLAYFCWKRDWRTVKGGVVGGVLLGLLQWLIAGTDNVIAFLTTVLPQMATSGQATIYSANVAITGFAARLFTPVDYVQPLLESQTLFLLTRVGLSLLVIGGLLWLTRRTGKQSEVDGAIFDLEYALALVSALLLMSSVADSGLVSLILVFGVLLRQSQDKKTIRGACLVAFLLSPIDLILRLGYLVTPDVRVSAFLLSTSFFSAVILWGVSSYALVKTHMAVREPFAVRQIC